MNIQGVVKFVDERGQEAVVRVGNVNLKVGIGRLTRTIEPIPVDQDPSGINVDLGPVLNSADLDLRGMQSEDALLSVEEFLDKALRDGLSSVRIIHGKGGGILRDGVRHFLKDNHLVKSFRPETPDNGGDGATYVNLT
jgi:DNA mismatch repair protein MutS2